jgi:hypothetical protein
MLSNVPMTSTMLRHLSRLGEPLWSPFQAHRYGLRSSIITLCSARPMSCTVDFREGANAQTSGSKDLA